MISTEILPPFVCGKTCLCLKKGNLVGVDSMLSMQVESIFPVAHNEEKVKSTSLCFLCQNGRIYVQRRKDKRFR